MNIAREMPHFERGPAGRTPSWARSLASAGMCASLLLLVTACGSSSPAANPAGSNTPSPASSMPASASTGSAGTISTTCPTAAQITSATGYDIPLKSNSTDSGTTICSYNSVSTGQSVSITITQANGVTASTLQQVVNSMAQAQQATASPLSGYGQAAFAFTQKDATSNADGIPSTVIGVLAGSQYLVIDAPLPIAKIEAVITLLMH